MSGQKSFVERYFADKTTRFDEALWNNLVREVDARYRELEGIKIDWEAISDQGIQVALDRINNVLLPASDRIRRVAELGFLTAPSATENILEEGETLTFFVTAGDQRDLFTPSPFVAITRDANATDYAIGRTLFYDHETGRFEVRIDAVFGAPGPHTDWNIAAVAGSVSAQVEMLADAQAARTAAETARTGAETARTDAQAARTDAQTARSGAETARTGAEAALAAMGTIGVDIQAHSNNLDALSAVTPGAAGTSMLALSLAADVRSFLDTAPCVLTRTALKALDTTKDNKVALLTEAGREGIFLWKTGNYSTHLAADTEGGVFIKANAIASTAGAWVRLCDEIDVRWFGAVGDGSDATAAFAAAISLSQFLKFNRVVCRDATKQFKIISLQFTANIEIDLYGGTVLGDFGTWGTHSVSGVPIYWTKNVFYSTAANAPSITLRNFTLNGQSDPSLLMAGGTPIIDFRGAASPGRCVVRFENFTLTRGGNRIYTTGSGITNPTILFDYRNMEVLLYNVDEAWMVNSTFRSSPAEMVQVQCDDQRTRLRIRDCYFTKSRDNNPASKWSSSGLNVFNCHPSSEMRNTRFWFFGKSPVNWESDGGLIETCEFDFVDDSNGLDFNEASSYRHNQFVVRNCYFKDIVNVGIRCSSSNTLFENNTFEDVNICIGYEAGVVGDPAKGTWLKANQTPLVNNVVRNCWAKSFNAAHANKVGIRAIGVSAALPVQLTIEGGSVQDRQASGRKPLYGVYGQNVNLTLRGYLGDGTVALTYLTGASTCRVRDAILAPEVGEGVHTFHLDNVTLGKKAFVLDNCSRPNALDAGQYDFRVDGGTIDLDAIHVNGSPNFAGTSNNAVVARDGVIQGSATYDPPNLAAGAVATTTVTVTGARLALGERVAAVPSINPQGVVVTGAVSASNTVTVTYDNRSAAALDLGSHTVTAYVIKSPA